MPLTVLSVAGALQGISIASPWSGQSIGWLQLLSLATLAYGLAQAQGRVRAAVYAGTFATCWLAATFWWMYIAMHTYAGLPAWMAALAVLSLAMLLGTYYAIAGAIFAAVAPSSQLGAALVFAATWMLAELARGLWFTGFGWGAIGYAHIEHLAGAAPYVGVYGISAYAAFIAYLTACIFLQKHRKRLIGMLVLAAAPGVLINWLQQHHTQPAGTIQVALLQGNIAQDEKFQPGSGVADALHWYGEQIRSSPAPLTVAPETAIPVLPHQLPDDYWGRLQESIQRDGRAVLLGIPLGSEAHGYTNSVVGINGVAPKTHTGLPMAFQYRYDKHHLVPFGEFIPPLFRWFTEMMAIPLGDFNRGDIGQASFEWQGQRLAPNICYEDLFGEELSARFLNPQTAPTIFVNVSNIGWFGNTVAIDQHLGITRMRAVEFGRPFIRATNTGKTAVVDHVGRVTHALPRHTRGVLVADVEGRTGVTPYAWWTSRWGLWPLWFLGLGVVLGGYVFRRRGA